MQYPIIDTIVEAYQRNGWTGLTITDGKNLFNYQNVSSTYTITNNNGVFTNAITDSRTYVRWRIRLLQDNTIVFNGPLSNATIGLNSTTVDASEYSFNRIGFIISGADSDMSFYFYFNSNEVITFSFNLISDDPQVIGGVVFDNVQIENGTEATPYEPYGATSNDFPNRLKLPLPHYFPHPVIDALTRASAGTQTAEDTEILKHYLTPLGIGGI